MSEVKGFEPQPRQTSMLDVCNQAFENWSAGRDDFDVKTFEDGLGLQQEQVIYKVPHGDGSDVSVRITRPSVDTADFLRLAEGTIDEKPKADAWVQAPRSFLFNLANGEKYYADEGFFRVVVLSDGAYLDLFSIAFKTVEDAGVERRIPATVGSMLRPLPPETDWIIQDLISPKGE